MWNHSKVTNKKKIDSFHTFINFKSYGYYELIPYKNDRLYKKLTHDISLVIKFNLWLFNSFMTEGDII